MDKNKPTSNKYQKAPTAAETTAQEGLASFRGIYFQYPGIRFKHDPDPSQHVLFDHEHSDHKTDYDETDYDELTELDMVQRQQSSDGGVGKSTTPCENKTTQT